LSTNQLRTKLSVSVSIDDQFKEWWSFRSKTQTDEYLKSVISSVNDNVLAYNPYTTSHAILWTEAFFLISSESLYLSVNYIPLIPRSIKPPLSAPEWHSSIDLDKAAIWYISLLNVTSKMTFPL